MKKKINVSLTKSHYILIYSIQVYVQGDKGYLTIIIIDNEFHIPTT